MTAPQIVDLPHPFYITTNEYDKVFVGWAFYDQQTGKLFGITAYSEALVADASRTAIHSAVEALVYPRVWYPVLEEGSDDGEPSKILLDLDGMKPLYESSGSLDQAIATRIRIPIYRNPTIFKEVIQKVIDTINGDMEEIGSTPFSLAEVFQVMQHHAGELDRFLLNRLLESGLSVRINYIPV